MKPLSGEPAELTTLQLYATPSHTCSYLESQEAVTLFADPSANISNRLYSELSELGFRRSGNHIYRPHCRKCRACIPVRVPVGEFKPSRSQKRSMKKNQDLDVIAIPVGFHDEHYKLYRKYITSRHKDGGMDQDSPGHYMAFINSPWSEVNLYEFRLRDELLAIAVTDHLCNGLSAVYSYFEPDVGSRSLGTYMVLWQIEYARKLGLQYVYLGYWIKQCRKMAYKTQYQPIEFFDGNQWLRQKIE